MNKLKRGKQSQISRNTLFKKERKKRKKKN